MLFVSPNGSKNPTGSIAPGAVSNDFNAKVEGDLIVGVKAEATATIDAESKSFMF